MYLLDTNALLFFLYLSIKPFHQYRCIMLRFCGRLKWYMDDWETLFVLKNQTRAGVFRTAAC